MPQPLKQKNLFRYIYYILMIILLAHTITCYYAYALAVDALGYRNFGTEDYFWDMIKKEGKSVHFPNYDFYKILLAATLCSILAFPPLVLVNFALHRAWQQITFEPRIVLITLFVVVIFILLFIYTDVFSWFMQFVMD